MSENLKCICLTLYAEGTILFKYFIFFTSQSGPKMEKLCLNIYIFPFFSVGKDSYQA